MKVVGTAGHIDHGKSTLVRALTGIDPDRLEEEKRRGMTIDLGFASLILPSGREVSIVDVPGHERFIKNMLAGAGGIDVALLVVAADEGPMPQTREHLDILDLLGVSDGVVALTKSELVDAEWIDLVRAEVEELLKASSLAGSSIVTASAVTGSGIQNLLEALDSAVDRTPAPAPSGVPFLPVDRVFTAKGFGTVVTGTLHGDSIRVGDEVEIAPGRRRARVRSLQTHKRERDAATPGSRVAVNLVGVERIDVERGDVLALPGTVPATRRFSASLRVVRDAPFPLHSGTEVTVHIGAAERAGTVRLLQQATLAPGSTGWAEVRLQSEAAVLRGQRFVLRVPSPGRTIAGGVVVEARTRRRMRGEVEAVRLAGLGSEDLGKAVLAALAGRLAKQPAELAAALGARTPDVIIALDELSRSGRVERLGGAYLTAEAWDEVAHQATRVLSHYHDTDPDRRGMPREELRRKLRLSPAQWPDALRRLEGSGAVRVDDGTVALPSHRSGVESRREEADRLLAALRGGGYSPPGLSVALDATGTDRGLATALVEAGELVRVDSDVWYPSDVYEEMVSRIFELIRTHGPTSVAEIRDALGTSRKYALAVLEHLDGEHRTRRVGDLRVLGREH